MLAMLRCLEARLLSEISKPLHGLPRSLVEGGELVSCGCPPQGCYRRNARDLSKAIP